MQKKLFEFLPLMLFAVLGMTYLSFSDARTAAPEYDDSTFGNARIVRVVDGDTFEADLDDMDENVKVRLLGVNTPESVDPRRPVECFGKEASDFVKELAEGRRALLEPDPEADERDKYGRMLRYAYLEDGTEINRLLIAEGYGFAYTSFPMNDEVKAEFLALERQARGEERGLWSPETCGESVDN